MHAGMLPSHRWVPPFKFPVEEQYGYTIDGWYFWEAAGTSVVGPFDTFEAAEETRSKKYGPARC